MVRLFSLSILLTLSAALSAATYVPLPVEEQLKKSYGVIEGSYQGSSYKRLPNGDVITLASFHVSKLSGLKNSEIKNDHDFRVILPGGSWDGLVYQVSGVPKFQKGESVVLLLEKGRFGFYLHNLALGKYQVVDEEGASKSLKSDVFPHHTKLGRIEYGDFEKMVAKRFGHKLTPFSTDKYVYIPPKLEVEPSQEAKELSGRTIASAANDRGGDSGFNPIWLVLILSALGAYSIYLVRGK